MPSSACLIQPMYHTTDTPTSRSHHANRHALFANRLVSRPYEARICSSAESTDSFWLPLMPMPGSGPNDSGVSRETRIPDSLPMMRRPICSMPAPGRFPRSDSPERISQYSSMKRFSRPRLTHSLRELPTRRSFSHEHRSSKHSNRSRIPSMFFAKATTAM